MEDVIYAVNRSDANHPEEVNPWKEHVIENEPTHKEPRRIPSPGDIPHDNDQPLHDDRERAYRAAKNAIQDKKTIPQEIATPFSGPSSATGIDLPDLDM